MPKKIRKQKIVFHLRFGRKKIAVTKPRLEWAILIVLVASVVAAQVSGLYPYVYAYSKCKSEPFEVRGQYYRTPYDENYGIHIGSDYSRCLSDPTSDLQRDPSTKVGARLIQQAKDRNDFSSGVNGYTVYVPKGYKIEHLGKTPSGNGIVTSYVVAYEDITFRVRVMKRDSDMSYTNLCSQPPTEKWSGEVIAEDATGRKICRTHSFYVNDYVVGVNIGDTGVMLHAPLNKTDTELNDAAVALFSVMNPYTE